MQVTEGQAAILNAGLNSAIYTISTKGKGSVEGAVLSAGVGALTGGAGEAAVHAGLHRTALANSLANQIFIHNIRIKEAIGDY